jgi:hypothetical protein
MNHLFIHSKSIIHDPLGNVMSHDLQLDIEVLRSLVFPPENMAFYQPGIVYLNPLPGKAYLFRTEAVKPVFSDTCMWHGTAPENPEIYADLCITGLEGTGDIAVAGQISIANKRYAITPTGNGYVRIDLVRSQGITCHEPAIKPQDPEASHVSRIYDNSNAAEAIITVLALYPTAIKQRVGENNIKAIVGHMLEQANQIFKNTAIHASVNVLAMEEFTSFKYTEVVDLLQNEVVTVDVGGTGKVTRMPQWDAVSERRDVHNADIVLLLGEGQVAHVHGMAVETVGIASSLPEPVRHDVTDLSVATLAISVTTQTVGFDPGMTFAHELGHLLGAKHSRHTQPTRLGLSPMYDYAHAYIAPDKAYATVMGYTIDSPTLIPAFSAAGQVWQGKKLGTPIDQPLAADVASLLRVSTAVMASYRGTSPNSRTEQLQMIVDPVIGGTILPSELGPYPKNAMVTVKAIPRAGHQFKGWELDGLPAGKANPMVIKMDQAHALKAQYETGKDYQFSVIADATVAAAGGTLKLDPAGEKFPYGTEMKVQYVPSTTHRDSATEWTIDGKLTGIPVSEKLVLLPEENKRIGVCIGAVDVVSHDLNLVVGMYCYRNVKNQQFNIVFHDTWGPLGHTRINVSTLERYQDKTGIKEVRLQQNMLTTDCYGRATLQFDLGTQSTPDVSLFLAFTMEGRPSESAIILTLPLWTDTKLPQSVCVQRPSNWNQYIVAGKTPASTTFKFVDRHQEPCVNFENSELHFRLNGGTEPQNKTGIKLVNETVKTDLHASVLLSCAASDKSGKGSAITYLKTSWVDIPLFGIHLLPAMISDLLRFEKNTVISAGKSVQPLMVWINEDYRFFYPALPIFGKFFCDLNMRVELDAGDTGLVCQQITPALATLSSLSTKGQGFPLFLGTAKQKGLAKLKLHLEQNGIAIYDSPIEMTITVQ